MTRRRWIADRLEGDRAFLTGKNAEHLTRVLRARLGQEFDIAAGDVVRAGKIVAISGDSVEFELAEAISQPAQACVRLVLAVFKFDRMEWAIEKAVELGIASIQPVVVRRTESHLAAAAVKRAERWRRIAREAAQQSRRGSVPEVAEPVKLKDALAIETGVRIVLSEVERNLSLKEALQQRATNHEQLATVLAIGPEGGWTGDELKLFADAGWISASLGKTILRAETAAIAAVAIALSMHAD